MKFAYKDPLGPATQLQVDDFQTEICYTLPQDYKQFLVTVGGGYGPDKHLAYPKTWKPGIVIQNIYGPQSDDYLDIRKTRDSMYVPACFLNFASDPGGELFVMDLRPETEFYGKIYVRDHDHAFNPKPFLTVEFFEEYDCDPDEARLYHFIAGSFTEFLDLLKTDEEIDAE